MAPSARLMLDLAAEASVHQQIPIKRRLCSLAAVQIWVQNSALFLFTERPVSELVDNEDNPPLGTLWLILFATYVLLD